ncbi:hypothetical protein OCAE111667_05285 [Occultella aeris]|uniref:Uncharacterized protein n=1 Tax=Occultella aeris TaxID=2761496 RepID=A0A7M4DM56_9MICO|nr:hypothetical protein [Occultella aeris]VZO38388.1 hypothetical protein HALOF300_03224 [Occultella aeris]
MARTTGLFQAPEDLQTLYEDIPPHLRLPLQEWVGQALRNIDGSNSHAGARTAFGAYDLQFRPSDPLLMRLERRGSWQEVIAALNDREFLQLIDWCLLPEVWSNLRRDLDTFLLKGGSAWTVYDRTDENDNDEFGLERRVPEGVQVAAEATIASAGHAGERLAQAWHHAFGVNPNPSAAYRDAIRAVEDAMKNAVSPNDNTATLGKMLATIESQKNWTLPLQRTDPRAEPAVVIVGMLRALWVGQADRHGGDPAPALAITQEAAETAVMLAVPLVHWFTSGHAARRSGT